MWKALCALWKTICKMKMKAKVPTFSSGLATNDRTKAFHALNNLKIIRFQCESGLVCVCLLLLFSSRSFNFVQVFLYLLPLTVTGDWVFDSMDQTMCFDEWPSRNVCARKFSLLVTCHATAFAKRRSKLIKEKHKIRNCIFITYKSEKLIKCWLSTASRDRRKGKLIGSSIDYMHSMA